MTASILVPFDGSPLSRRALEHAVEVFPSASITAITVVDPIESIFSVETGGLPVADAWHEEALDEAHDVLDGAIVLAAEHDIELETVTRTGRPAQEILEYADDHDVDHIVMGSHGREGIERTLLGSVAETVTRRSRKPVTIVR